MKLLIPFLLAGMVTFQAQAQVESITADTITSKRGDGKALYYAEQQPQFPGGTAGLMSYLSDHIVYPAVAKENNITGRIVVQFIVTGEGEVTMVKIVKSPCSIGVDEKACKALEKEAIRVVSTMPKWKPGTMDGKPVSVYYNLPIRFALTDNLPAKSGADKKEERH